MKIVSIPMTGGIVEIVTSAIVVCAVRAAGIHIESSIAKIFSTVIFRLNASDASILSIQRSPMNASIDCI